MALGGMPNVCCAIDGSEIPCERPRGTGDAFVNRKDKPSIKLQGVVDANGIFLDASTGYPGRWNDAGAYAKSDLHNKFHGGRVGQLMRRCTVSIPTSDTRLPLQCIADSAYPCEDVMLPAFKYNLALDHPDQRRFNARHASTRGPVERAFGRLKGRWRILRRDMNLDLKLCNMAIMACVVLHNVCERNGVPLEPDVEAEIEEIMNEQKQDHEDFEAASGGADARITPNGATVRSLLVDFFAAVAGQNVGMFWTQLMSPKQPCLCGCCGGRRACCTPPCSTSATSAPPPCGCC